MFGNPLGVEEGGSWAGVTAVGAQLLGVAAYQSWRSSSRTITGSDPRCYLPPSVSLPAITSLTLDTVT